MLIDNYGRQHDYLRISLTDKCNLRCFYCIPEKGTTIKDHCQILRIEEFLQLIDIFYAQGVRKIRFTGGEPLLKKGLSSLLLTVHQKYPDILLGLTTNGLLLAENLDLLEECNVQLLNISIDSLKRNRYQEITGFDQLPTVLKALDLAAKRKKFKIKVNAVLMEESLAELPDFCRLSANYDIPIRFIELMPNSAYQTKNFIPAQKLLAELTKCGDVQRNSSGDSKVAHSYNVLCENGVAHCGIISAISTPFCQNCNRLRLDCFGNLRTCLFATETLHLRDLLQQQISSEQIIQKIKEFLNQKAEHHQLNEQFSSDIDMFSIGG